jgi:hypothetical protein
MSKQYSFILRDTVTRQVTHEGEWFNTSDARDAVLRQTTTDGSHLIERIERETNRPGEDRPGEFTGPQPKKKP